MFVFAKHCLGQFSNGAIQQIGIHERKERFRKGEDLFGERCSQSAFFDCDRLPNEVSCRKTRGNLIEKQHATNSSKFNCSD